MLPLETGGIDLGPLLPEHLSEIIAGIVLFLIIWWVVAKKVVPVFEQTYAERTAEIAGGIEKAESRILDGHLHHCVMEAVSEGREQEVFDELIELYSLANR